MRPSARDGNTRRPQETEIDPLAALRIGRLDGSHDLCVEFQRDAEGVGGRVLSAEGLDPGADVDDGAFGQHNVRLLEGELRIDGA